MMSRFFQQWAFALRNVFRQRARSAGTLAAISLGVAGLILAGGFVQDVFVQLGEAVILKADTSRSRRRGTGKVGRALPSHS